MLGLGSSVNSEEGYAKAERYRERYHSAIQLNTTWNETTNPIGRDGREAYYIGDFTGSVYDKHFTTVQVAGNDVDTDAEVYKFRCAIDPGYVWTTLSTVPYTSYTLLATWDPTNEANGNGKVSVGNANTALGVINIASSDVIDVTEDDTDVTLTFNSGNNTYVYLGLHIIGGGKWGFYGDISFKEA